MLEIKKNQIPKKMYEFILEQHKRGVKYKQIVKMVREKFGENLMLEDVRQLVREYELETDEARYEVK
jgi:hypothetical protein